MGFGWGQRLNPAGIANPSPFSQSTSYTPRRDRHTPRVTILRSLPFTVPFETRVLIFRHSVARDRSSQGGDIETAMWGPDGAVVARCTVRRGREFEDGFSGLNALGSKLKKRISITFVNELGMEEAGIDGGGVFKEFLTRLSKQAFDINYGLFQATREQRLYPNPSAYARGDDQLRYLEFLGRVVGKAMYEGILVDVQFAEFFLAKWLGRQSYLDDLPSLDPELYQGMIFLKNYQGNVEDLALNLTVSEQEFGQTRNVELVRNGSQIPVTNENRIQYIYMVANYKLNFLIARQSAAFFSGLKDIVNPRWLRMFNQQELQMLLSGSSSLDIDLQDLKRNVVYAQGFDESHPTIANFWKIVERDFTPEERSLLVRFVTSCSRPPLLGFSELNPKFSIRSSGEDENRLPTASTCVNLLKLPVYKDESQMRTKLRYAINSGAGFELS
ncbi:HECT-domain-containing protein [Gonapodya prolifera JEL478]|uniref:HECT-type E3 ubiquitin transferase n=1 Tax=Gonapodya prolifera (strain JEL478) TaxID=1344416 RepID=A0A139B021_GONPJ|nr:HECT-domain-containing protein [Gonapodya prolifera JEL478]|eukprot:KXS22341.1 HECT-domain-containing protein [Gonapodya prolifera JEL478]